MLQLATLRNLGAMRASRCKRDREEDEELLATSNLVSIQKHSPAFFRKRWDMDYLVDFDH